MPSKETSYHCIHYHTNFLSELFLIPVYNFLNKTIPYNCERIVNMKYLFIYKYKKYCYRVYTLKSRILCILLIYFILPQIEVYDSWKSQIWPTHVVIYTKLEPQNHSLVLWLFL